MDLVCFCSVLCLLCLCARLFICALWSPAGKGLTSWLSFVVSTVSLSLSHWYPGSGVVLDCIDSRSLHPYLLCNHFNWEERNIVDCYTLIVFLVYFWLLHFDWLSFEVSNCEFVTFPLISLVRCGT